MLCAITSSASRNRIVDTLLPTKRLIGSVGLKVVLAEVQWIHKIVAAAVIAINQGEYEKFDALVGENACQTRAFDLIKTLNSPENYSNFLFRKDSLREELDQVANQIDALLQADERGRTPIDADLKAKKPPYDVLAARLRLIELTPAEIKLVQMYVLTISAEEKIAPPTATSPAMTISLKNCPKKLKETTGSNLSTAFMNDILYQYRTNLSACSVAEMIALANSNTEDSFIRKALSKECLRCHTDLQCVPMFWTYKAILQALSQMDFIIVLDATVYAAKDTSIQTSVRLFFKRGVEIDSKAVAEEQPQTCCFVVEGDSCGIFEANNVDELRAQYLAALRAYSMETIVLSGAADHRQYPTQAFDDEVIARVADPHFAEMKKLAGEAGFSLDNPRKLFFILHVFLRKLDHYRQDRHL